MEITLNLPSEALSLTDYKNENITQKNGPKDVKETQDIGETD